MDQNFKQIAIDLDVRPLLSALEAQPHLWSEITARQTTQGSPHRDTETIFLRWAQELSVETVFTAIPAIDYPAFYNLPEARALIAQLVALIEAKEIGRIIITKLKSGGRIEPHADEGAYADYYERFHVVLSSGKGNLFFVEQPGGADEYTEMEQGSAWWFHHKRKHWVVNNSQADRIHLIVDAVAPSFRRERD